MPIGVTTIQPSLLIGTASVASSLCGRITGATVVLWLDRLGVVWRFDLDLCERIGQQRITRNESWPPLIGRKKPLCAGAIEQQEPSAPAEY
jgi:hypothetical protein